MGISGEGGDSGNIMIIMKIRWPVNDMIFHEWNLLTTRIEEGMTL